MSFRPSSSWSAVLLILVCLHGYCEVPLLVNHQGFISVSGSAFQGSGQFRFALIDGDSGVNLWTNDGSTVGGTGIPAAPVILGVSQGLYSVALGNDTIPNMTALPSTVFDSPKVLLRIWFDDGANGLRQLAPDQVLGSVPYSVHAGIADTAIHAATADNALEAAHAAEADVATTALDSLPSGLLVLSSTFENPAPGFTFTGVRVEGQDSAWEPAAPMDTAVGSAASAVLDGRLHVFSGQTDMSLETVHQVYNPANDEWSLLDPLPVGRIFLNACTLGGKIYVFGGIESGTVSVRTDIYDPDLNSWSPGERMPVGRSEFALTVLDGKIHVIGGFHPDPFRPLDDHSVYDPETNTWSPAAPLPEPFADTAGAVVGGKIYVFTIAGRVFEYDPVGNNWTERAPHLIPFRSFKFAALLNGRIHLLGGTVSVQTPVSFHEAYDPANDTWSTQPPLPTAVWAASGGVIDGQIHVVGGNIAANSVTPSHQVFTPATSFFVFNKD